MLSKFESLESTHSNLSIVIRSDMPPHLGGCCVGNYIAINANRNEKERYQVLQEEIAHYDTSVGDIANYNKRLNRKQEKKARSIAMERAVPLDSLIYCFNNELWSTDEVADYLGVTPEYLWKAIENYRQKRGDVFKYKGYIFDLTSSCRIDKSISYSTNS